MFITSADVFLLYPNTLIDLYIEKIFNKYIYFFESINLVIKYTYFNKSQISTKLSLMKKFDRQMTMQF